MQPKLIDLKTGTIYKISKKGLTVGRNAANNITLKDPYISRNHCKISTDGKNYFIEDFDSQNGTFINGHPIKNKTRLNTGDIVSLSYKAPMFKFITSSYSLNKETIKITSILLPFFIIVGLLFSALYYIYSYKLSESKRIVDHLIVKKELGKILKKITKEECKVEGYFEKKIENYVYKYKHSKDFEEAVILKLNHDEMIKSIFSQYNIPYEFTSLAVVESYFRKNAYNHYSGAKGIWQLMPGTAMHYGLKVNKKIDERTDPEKSTEAAAAYLNDLLSLFGYNSFLLAVAAYNSGEGTVNSALKKIENPKLDRNFWYLYKKKLLPKETEEYVLKVLAIMVLFNDANYIDEILNEEIKAP